MASFEINNETRNTKPIDLTPEAFHREALHGALVSLGNHFLIEPHIDGVKFEKEVQQFENNWKPYNPRKTNFNRYGLSLYSLDGGMGGEPDLDSLPEYNGLNNTDFGEEDFKEPTLAFERITSISQPLKEFKPFMRRSHLIRLNEGGFFPYHRDAQKLGIKTIRLFAPLTHCNPTEFCFLHGFERLNLETNHIYFINTRIEHALFSMAQEGSTFLVINLELNAQSLDLIYKNLRAF